MALAAFSKVVGCGIVLIVGILPLRAQDDPGTEIPLPWHLQNCSENEACLDILPVWKRFSDGNPATTVVVMENKLHRDTRTAAFGHAGLDSAKFEVIAVESDITFMRPADGFPVTLRNIQQIRTEAVSGFGKTAAERSAGLPPAARDQFCTFVSNSTTTGRNHDLHMAALIGGQLRPGTSGVAPGVSLALVNGTIEAKYGSAKEGNELAQVLPRRQDIRVINVSQQAPDAGEPHWAQYQRLHKFAMRVAARAPVSDTDRRSRVLVVAAAGNRSSVHSTQYTVNTSLDYRIPSEAIHTRAATQEDTAVDLSPNVPAISGRGDLPLIVVGAVRYDRLLPEYGRLDPGVSVLAPSGVNWSPKLAEAAKAETVTSADWQKCLCASVYQRQTGAVKKRAASQKDCARLANMEGLDRLLGIPVIDYHSRSKIFDDLDGGSAGGLCGVEPMGVCQTTSIGTSGAAALVSGVAALMFSLDPTLSGEEVAGIITTTAMNTSRDGLPVVNPMAAMEAVQIRMIDSIFETLARADRKDLESRMATTFHVLDQERKIRWSTGRSRTVRALLNGFDRTRWRVEQLLDSSLAGCSRGALATPDQIRGELAKSRPCAPPQNAKNALYQIAVLSDGVSSRIVRILWAKEHPLDGAWRLAGLQLGEIKNEKY